MMWTVYVRINEANGKRYVGVTSKGIDGRWQRAMSEADEIKNMLVARCDAYLGPKIHRRLMKLVGTLEYDLAVIGTDKWTHEVVLSTDDLVEALLRERDLIRDFACRRPAGYNRSDGGEIPPYTNVIDVLRWARAHV